MPHDIKRVSVVGGGILGVSSAVHLARRGVHVTLITEGELASEASGRSLSWLNSAGERSPEYHRLRMLGIDRYRTFAARHDASPYLRFDGGLMWARDGASYRERYAHERELGYDARWLDPDEIAAWTPGVDSASVAREGAIFNPGEGWVDLPSIIDVLAREFVGLGGELLTGAGKASVLMENGCAAGVIAADGQRIEADAVLLATGASVPDEVAQAGVAIREDTPIALLVRTRPVETGLRAVLNTPRVAVRRTPNDALVMDSGWSERSLIRRDDGGADVPDGVVEELLAEATRVLAGHPKLVLDEFRTGPKPIPGDGEPVLGRLDEVDGYYVAFSHSGATLGLIAGELLAEEILTGEESSLLATFRPGRFSAE